MVKYIPGWHRYYYGNMANDGCFVNIMLSCIGAQLHLPGFNEANSYYFGFFVKEELTCQLYVWLFLLAWEGISMFALKNAYFVLFKYAIMHTFDVCVCVCSDACE